MNNFIKSQPRTFLLIALSLPEMIILRKVLKPHLIATFIGVVAVGIMRVGYVFKPWCDRLSLGVINHALKTWNYP